MTVCMHEKSMAFGGSFSRVRHAAGGDASGTYACSSLTRTAPRPAPA